MRIGDFVQTVTVTVEPTASIQAAAQQMREHHVGDVVVATKIGGKKTPIGILTDRDIVVELLAAGVELDTVRVVDVMSNQLIKANVNLDVDEAIELMQRHGIRRLPLVNDEGVLVSVVSVDDLLGLSARRIANLYALALHEREHEELIR